MGFSARAASATENGMMTMSKYDALRVYLAARGRAGDTIRMSFAEVASVLGTALPRSALEHRAWWANQTDTDGRAQAAAWTDAGFRVAALDQSPGGWVEFEPVEQYADRDAREGRTASRLVSAVAGAHRQGVEAGLHLLLEWSSRNADLLVGSGKSGTTSSGNSGTRDHHR
jgi:hypothetical protein